MTAHIALIVAAGTGSRCQTNIPKQYITINGKAVIAHTVDTFLAIALFSHIYIVVQENDNHINTALTKHPKLSILKCGGRTRAESVINAATVIQNDYHNCWLSVHDAARANIKTDTIHRLLTTVNNSNCGGFLAVPVQDTLKQTLNNGSTFIPVNREQFISVQTPQTYRINDIIQALTAHSSSTDESSAIDLMGINNQTVMGQSDNIKLTYNEDLPLFGYLLKREP